MTTAATSFVFSNASTRTRNSFGRSASASQMVDRLFSAALHRGSAQRSSDGAVTTATDGEGVAAASPTSDRRRRDFTTIRVVVEDAPPAHAARGAPVRRLDVPDRRSPAVDRGPKHEGRGPLVVHAAVQARPGEPRGIVHRTLHTYKQGPLRSIALDHDLPKISIQSSLESPKNRRMRRRRLSDTRPIPEGVQEPISIRKK